MNIVFDLVNVKYQIKYADGVFCKQRLDKANTLGEINSKNRGVLDIAYLTIHVDAGALAFTRCKNLPPRHLPPRHFGETSKTHNTT